MGFHGAKAEVDAYPMGRLHTQSHRVSAGSHWFIVSILARSHERAIHALYHVAGDSRGFQSAPAHMSGRYRLYMQTGTGGNVFQSAPAHMSGRYPLAAYNWGAGNLVSIRARSHERAIL